MSSQFHNNISPLGRIGKRVDVTKLAVDQKMWVGRQIAEGQMTAQQVAKNYGIDIKLVQKYGRNVSNDIFIHKSAGRVGLLGEQQRKQFAEFIKAEKFLVPVPTARAWMLRLAQEWAEQRGIPPATIQSINDTSFYRECKKAGLRFGNAESVPAERVEAMEEFCNFVSFAATNATMVPYIHPSLILNADATQFKVGDDDELIRVVYFADEVEGPLKTAADQRSSSTCIFIKYYLCMSAHGYVAPPIFIICDESMEKEDLAVHELPAFGVGGRLDETAYLVFCRTRGCNSNFYEWFNTVVLIPFVQLTRKTMGLPEDSQAWFQLDGEAVQIKPYSGGVMLEQMKAANITVGKLPASTTAATQPCDVGNCFKATKTILKYLQSELLSDEARLDRVKQVIKKQSTYKTELVTKAGKALCKVRLALQKALNEEIITESFTEAGIYPLDIDKILGKCKNKHLKQDDYKLAKDSMAHFKQIVEDKGEITDEQFINKGLQVKQVKDALVVTRRRAIIMTNDQFAKKEREKKEILQREAAEKQQKLEVNRAKRAANKRQREEQAVVATVAVTAQAAVTAVAAEAVASVENQLVILPAKRIRKPKTRT